MSLRESRNSMAWQLIGHKLRQKFSKAAHEFFNVQKQFVRCFTNMDQVHDKSACELRNKSRLNKPIQDRDWSREVSQGQLSLENGVHLKIDPTEKRLKTY